MRPRHLVGSGARPLNFVVRSGMRRRTRIFIALLGGASITAVSVMGAIAASALGFDGIARVLYWPNTLLQGLTPCVPIRTDDHTFCEGTPLNDLAYFASFILGEVAYAAVIFVLLGKKRATS